MSDDADPSTDDCPRCGGTGYLQPEEGDPEYERLREKYGKYAWAYRTERRCICTKRKQFRQKVGEEIYQADAPDSSPLADHVDDNVFLTADRCDFLPHLKYTLAQEGLAFFFRQTNDAELRDVFLTNDDEAPYASPSQLAEPPDLLIISLGVLSYDNKAMGGYLLEIIRMRDHRGDPTWVVNPHNRPYQQGHFCYDPQTEQYLNRNFKHITIPRSSDPSGYVDTSPGEGSGGDDDMSVDDIVNDTFTF